MKTTYTYNQLNETSRRQKALKALNGNSNIKTMAIITSENPRYEGSADGKNVTNKDRRINLEKDLKLGHYAWFPVKGQYEGKENSYIIYNIPKESVLFLAKKFGQEAFIFIEGDKCEYYEQTGKNDFKKTHEKRLSDRIDMSNASDYFTQVSRSFKFQIPLFDDSDENKDIMVESIEYVNKIINKRITNINEATRRIDTTLKSTSGKDRYLNRSFLYGDDFLWD